MQGNEGTVGSANVLQCGSVDPSEVRKQTGSFASAFAKHAEDFKETDKVQRSRAALTKVASSSGQDLSSTADG